MPLKKYPTSLRSSVPVSGESALLGELRVRRGVNESLISRMISASPPSIPLVKLPALSNIQVRPNPPRSITDHDVRTWRNLYRTTKAPKRARPVGEAIGPNDEVCVDVIGFHNRHIVPFSGAHDLKLLTFIDAFAPGLSQSLIGSRVGARITVTAGAPFLPSPSDKAVVFSVHIKSSNELEMVSLNSSEWPEQLGLGVNPSAAFEKLAIEVNNDWIQRSPLLCVNEILDVIREHVQIQVPKEAIDLAIFAKWIETEGRLLQQAELPSLERDAALRAWLDDEKTRETCSRFEANILVLDAIKRQEKLKFDPKTFATLLEDVRLPVIETVGTREWNSLSAPFNHAMSAILNLVLIG